MAEPLHTLAESRFPATIYVIGTCQAIPLAACLSVMLPDVRFVQLPMAAGRDALEPGALVLRQREPPFMTPKEPRPNEITYPGIWFNAFHPDVVYLVGPWGPVVPPLGNDHSSLVLYAWQRGMSTAQTAKLFTEPVFERLRFFDCWAEAKRSLLDEAHRLGFSFDAAFARLERVGCFMHSPIHPALVVVAELARELVRRLGLPASVASPELYLEDPMLRVAVWPVYPEIGARLGLPGAYAFKPPHAPGAMPLLLDLEEFIARSFEAYDVVPPGGLVCRRLENPAYRDLESIAAGERKGSRNGAPRVPAAEAAVDDTASPYAALPAERFWRRAVARVPAAEIDPVGTPPFRIDRGTRIATAGSCFARNMARVLTNAGYTFFVPEPPPDDMPPDAARRAGYRVFSTRTGDIYTARQLLQLFDRAFGTFAPRDGAWLRPDGRYADPFRPRIEPDGFATANDVLAARERHLAAVRTMFEELDVLIFTLGLTEAWRSTADGAVFPLAPGVSAGRMNAADYEFVNFTAAAVREDLDALLARLRAVNPRARVVLTVSPVPLVATYEPRHVLVSAAFSKAALRVAADEIERAHANVWYFPAYELVAGGYNRGVYFEDDLRTVTPQGVDHVMRLFLAHAADDFARAAAAAPRDALVANETFDDAGAVCDEEALAYDPAAAVPPRAAGLPHPEWADYEWSRDFSDLTLPEPAPAPARAMEPLVPASMRAPLEAALPAGAQTRAILTIPCTVRNDGDAALFSDGPHAVFVCYRWFDASGNLTEVGRAIHTPLPGVLAPGTAVTLAMRVETPQYPGTYRLRAALLQSQIAWFDDVDPANGVEAVVVVAARAAAEGGDPAGAVGTAVRTGR